MFKPADDLRLAAQMRALQRVAAPWRQARTRWFDGSPESLEARLATTDRVLVHARSGLTAAHLELAGEAEAARLELLAGRHRLLTDFLDDGARAFRGSRRTANEDEFIDCPYCGAESDAAEFRDGVCPVCGKANYETHPFYARRTASGGYTPGHGFPIAEGDDVHWIGDDGHPDLIPGRVIEYPAIGPDFDGVNYDPDAEIPYHDMALVDWGDDGVDLAELDDIVPNHHLNDFLKKFRRGPRRTASTGGLDWKYNFGKDDGTRGHDATTEVGDLLQTHPEYPTGRHPTKPNVKRVLTDQPPVGWGYGIWLNQPVGPDSEFYDGGFGVDEDGNDRDGNLIHAGDNGRIIYPTHDEAKAAAEQHYYSLDHAGRNRDRGGQDSGVDYSDLNKFMGGGDGPDDDFGHIFGSRRTASGQLDDLTQRKALNLVRQWMHNRYGDEDSKDPMVPSGQKAYESGAGLKLHPSWVPSWQDPITGQMNDEPPVPAILHEGITGWADDASFDDDLAEQLRQVGVEAGNWNGSIMTLHPHQEWDLKDALQKALPAEHGPPPATASRRAAAVLPDFPDELMF